MDLEGGETFTLSGTCSLPQVGDHVIVRDTEEGMVVAIETSEDPAVRVKDLMELWKEIGYLRLRRLTYELKGFSSLMDDEQAAIFAGLPNATAVGMFIEECRHRNAYRHEQKYVRAIREVAKAHHFLS
ncbi:hypothetical protein D3C84_980110 [compost metagenome]